MEENLKCAFKIYIFLISLDKLYTNNVIKKMSVCHNASSINHVLLEELTPLAGISISIILSLWKEKMCL